MIDLHSHILYDVDDGARTLDDSLAIGRTAAASGTTVIAATPHSPSSSASRHYDPALIRERSAEISSLLKAEGIELEIVPGTEICYDGSVVERLRRGQLLTYGTSRTVLVEIYLDSIPQFFDTVLFELQTAGYRVLLAHPERITDIQHDPNRLIPLVERGVLMQLTAEALVGAQGGRIQRLAQTLVSHHMVHIIASDAHGIRIRPPNLALAYEEAAKIIGSEAAQKLVKDYPAAILADTPIRAPQPIPVKQHFPWRGR
jgi:protein-tyrosine phosphatase